MPKKGIVLVITGTVLMLSALSLALWNLREDSRAGQEAENLLPLVQAVIETKQETPEPSADATDTPEETLSPELPTVEFGGYEYVGYLSVPDLELELPVMAEWDYSRLKIAPCRQFGSSRTDDLVIAAHNYKSHFGRLKELKAGSAVIFTDTDGIENHYAVVSVETMSPTDVDAVQNSGYALVLYTCTPGGATRVAVFCSRTEEADTENDG